MKGIILAGRTQRSHWPWVGAAGQQLVSVHDKPMIYYPLSTLITAGARDIMVITDSQDASAVHRILGDGSQFGVSLSYGVQPEPHGVAQALTIGAEFIGSQRVALVLGDSILHGPGLDEAVRAAAGGAGAHIFAYRVAQPHRYGVIELDQAGRPLTIEEKPQQPRSQLAIPGLYFFDADVVEIARSVSPSARGVYEISDVARYYLEHDRLTVCALPHGCAWYDASTLDGLADASGYVKALQNRQGLVLGAPELAARQAGFLSDEEYVARARHLSPSDYGSALLAGVSLDIGQPDRAVGVAQQQAQAVARVTEAARVAGRRSAGEGVAARVPAADQASPTPFAEPVLVTKPLLPPLAEVNAALEEVWAAGWLTNGGRQHQKLERTLSRRLDAPHLSLFANGTLALMVGCQALRLSGEVITTPFTFPATIHALNWNGLTPVFADIDPVTLCLDPASVERAVTRATTGIMGVHVYGIPCDVEGIQKVASNYYLKVLYDAAHAFETTVNGRSIASFGDAVAFSFHATKLFHTAEGGALAVGDAGLKDRVDHLKNFGIDHEEQVSQVGINAKLSEVHAAVGNVVLPYVDAERAARARLRRQYQTLLDDVEGVDLMSLPDNATDSGQYLIARVNERRFGMSRDELHRRLRAMNVLSRKYFFPLASEYACYRSLPSASPAALPNAYQAASEVLALPYHGRLAENDVERICEVIKLASRVRVC